MQTDTQIEEKIEMVIRFLGILSIPSLQINLYVRYVKLCEITLGEIGTRGRIKKHSLLSYNVQVSIFISFSILEC